MVQARGWVGTQGGGVRLRPGWPLSVLFVGFPLWWAAGVSHFVFVVLAGVMAYQLARRPRTLVPHGFALWLLFLVWMAAGVLLVWAHAPDTVEVGGAGRIVGFGYRAAWYLAATVVMLYVLNLSERELPGRRVARLLAYMFAVTALFGLAGVLAPRFEFPSLLELALPGGLTDAPWVYSLIHPSLAEQSEFLGFTHPRPTAPFAYANSWGNNIAMYLPFFVLAWLGRDGGWRRWAGPPLLAVSVVPIGYSLNRGLWLALGAGAVYVALRLAWNGRVWAVQALLVATVAGGAVFVTTPLYDTVALRIETPHSNDRRVSTAEQVVSTTWRGAPVVGYGSTREMEGSFSSLAGGGTPECRQCAPPPLGTQGFMWRLILTTGFVGAALCLAFLAVQLVRHARGARPYAVVGCTLLVMSAPLFLVYDSLESPLFTLMIAIGLMNRERLGAEQPPEPQAPAVPEVIR
jgi:hypothetical protein